MRKSGAKPVLLTHWPMQDSPEDQSTIQALYNAAARKTGACLIRDSGVFESAQKIIGRQALYIEDKLHPTPLKSYLIAASVVRVLAGRPLRNLPLQITGEPINQDDGKRLGGSAILMTVTRQRSEQIARWAEAVRTGLGAEKAAVPKIPDLPKGQPLPPMAKLERHWSGPISLYPIPTTLSLTIKDGARPTVDVEIAGKGGLDKSTLGIPLKIVGRELQFVFPQGPNGTQILFRAVRHGATLTGLAHFRSTDGSLEGFGEWKVN